MLRYDLRDASGRRIATHCRVDGPEGKRMWWELPDGTRGLDGLSTADLPLYGIDRLTSTSTVLLVEGEKCVNALLAIGLPAVGTVTGAHATPSRAVLADLTGRRVVPWPDNDDVGRAHMTRTSLALADIASRVERAIAWPGAPLGGDAADFIAAGGTAADVIAMIEQTHLVTDGPAAVPELTAAPTRPRARIARLADVLPERVEWLWPGRIPLGKVTILDGDPGLGKSTLSLDLAARVTSGRPMPGEIASRPAAGVVILSAEDGLADTIRPRLDAAGADVERIVAIQAITSVDGEDRLVALPGDLRHVEEAIKAHGAILVIVDVLMAFLDELTGSGSSVDGLSASVSALGGSDHSHHPTSESDRVRR